MAEYTQKKWDLMKTRIEDAGYKMTETNSNLTGHEQYISYSLTDGVSKIKILAKFATWYGGTGVEMGESGRTYKIKSKILSTIKSDLESAKRNAENAAKSNAVMERISSFMKNALGIDRHFSVDERIQEAYQIGIGETRASVRIGLDYFVDRTVEQTRYYMSSNLLDMTLHYSGGVEFVVNQTKFDFDQLQKFNDMTQKIKSAWAVSGL